MAYLPVELPLPQFTPDDTPWWEATNREELVIQRCLDCDAFRHPPRPLCQECRSFRFQWQRVEGQGTIYSYVICHHPVHPALKARGPYNVVVVELPAAGNIRLVGNLVDFPDDQIRVGLPVHVVWERIAEDVVLPRWSAVAPARSPEGA